MGTVATTGNGSATSVPNNNGGTIVKGGNVSSSGPVANAVNLTSLADDFGTSVGSKVLAKSGTGASTTDRHGIAKIVSGNTLAYDAPRTATGPEKLMIRGVSTKIGGATSTFMAIPGSDYNGAVRDNIHGSLSTTAHGSGATAVYDIYARPSTEITPNFTKGGDAGSTVTFVAPSGDGNAPATDDAANPTRSIPGELTYNHGGLAAPTSSDYSARDSYEV